MKRLRNHFSKFLLLATVLSVTSAMGQISANYLIPGPTVGCGSLVVEFQDISTGNPTSWLWDFGNGLTSTDQNPVMLFNAGTYDVTLVVTDSVVFDTIVYNDIVKVFDNPEANFTADVTSGCLPLEVSFEDLSLSSSPIVSWFWDFGDGGNGNIQLPTYEYENQESYTVSLLVKDANGCDDLLVLPNYIKTETRPNLNFSATPQFSCNGAQLVSFTNTTISEHSLSYNWEFGDGGMSSTESPEHFYLNSGVFEVQLVASSMFCVDTLRKEGFTVDGMLSVDFSSDIKEGCESFTEVHFFNQSSIHATDWFWDFGDGTTSVEENPVHIYTTPGEYDVSLKVSYFGECPEMELKSSFIKVHPKPTLQFTVDTTKACHLPFLVQFSDNTIGATDWIWAIDGQEFSNNQNASFEFFEYGTHQVSLQIEDLHGCVNEAILEDSIRIEKPIADFSVDLTEGCTPLTVQFIDSSFSSENITAWSWDFGDGNTSNFQNPSHLYSSGGLFSVSLTIETGIGCVIQKSYTDLVKTTPSPVVDFSVDVTSVCGDDPVQFTDLSSSILPIDSWEWDFGYNPYYNSDEQNPTHVFQDTGLFSITLITEVGGCYDTLRVDDLIQVSSPISLFYVTENCDNYKEFHFFNESIDYDSCYWDFDDGTILHNPPHHFFYEFSDYGEYDVSLHVYNEEYDCWGVTTETMRVEPPLPAVSVDASTPASGCPPLTVLFHDDSPYSDENPNSPLVVWDMIQFGDENWSNWNYQNTYYEPGYYTVKQMVANPFGCVDTITLDSAVHVYDVKAEFSPEIISCDPFTVMFEDISFGDELITSWSWKFGDGETSIFPNPTHIYQAEGVYDIGLIVSTDGGCVDTLKVDSLITFSKPQADFSSLTNVCLSDTVVFTNTSTGENLSYVWNFSNGIQSDTENENHVFSQLGTYLVELIVMDAIGCADTASSSVQVQKPIASFTTNNITANCPPLITSFNDVSVGEIEQWLWDFGDSSYTTVQSPSHLYEESGSFDVSLVVIDSVGCRDTLTLADAVNVQGPYGEFLFSTNDVCANEPIDFTPLAFNTNSFVWNFDDGTFASGSSTTHQYDTLGVYFPSLLIENASGCQLLIESEDSILVEENTVFVDLAEDVTICKYESIEINLNTNGELISWWPNNGLSDTTIINPTASPLSTTSYVVTLADGYCQNKDTVTIFVDENLPDPSFQTTHLCYNTPVQFTDESTTIAGATWEWDFGDGTTSQQLNPEHTYNTIGLMPISLTITYDSTQCKSTLLDTVLVNPLPIADAGLDLEVCKGEDVLLSASGGVEYQWINAAVLGFEYMIEAIETTAFSVEVTDINNCKDIDQVIIYVKDLPFVDAGEDVSICEGEEVTLLAEGDGVFNWENGLSNQAGFLVSPLQTTTFLVSLLGDNGCENQDSLLVDVHSLPNISFASNSVVCKGEEISFRAYGDAGTDEIISWKWNFGDGFFESGREVVHIYEDVGGYDVSLKATSELNCENEFVLADVVRVNPNPIAEFYLDKRAYTAIENEVQFLNYSTDVTESYWDFGDGFYANTMEPSHQYEEGVYEVTLEVWNEYACSDKLIQEVTIESDYTLWIPNAFTPNGDGLDETFAPKGFGVEVFNMIVYTRWGEEIFFSQDLDSGWDGKLRGVEQAPTGIYTYRIVTEDANGKVRTYQGEINLML